METTSIRSRYWISAIFAILASAHIIAQSTPRTFLGGIRIVSTDITGDFDKRRNFEVQAYKRISRTLMLKSSLGYTSIRKNKQYVNFDYRNSGMYVKSGIVVFQEKDRGIAFHPGICLNYARFVERGKYVLVGDNFGDLTGYPRRTMQSVSLEPFVELHIDATDKLSFMTTFKYDWVLGLTTANSYPNLHIPGRGKAATGLDVSVVFRIQ